MLNLTNLKRAFFFLTALFLLAMFFNLPRVVELIFLAGMVALFILSTRLQEQED